MINKQSISLDLLLRFQLIETIVLWEGRLTSNVVCKAFGISRQQASKIINQYIDNCPQNLSYSKHLKGYVPNDNFKVAYTRGIADDYLQLLSNHEDLTSFITTKKLNFANTSVLYSPIRNIQAEVIRPIVLAARDRKRVEIEYISMSTPVSEGRVIVPHTLVWSGFRWHVRAYCEKNLAYRDFVLSRITNKPEIVLDAQNGIEDDLAWNTSVEIIIQPDPRLSANQKKVISKDYGMKKNKLVITTRGALVSYMMQVLRIDPHIVQSDPEAQQVEIVNIKELTKWLFVHD